MAQALPAGDVYVRNLEKHLSEENPLLVSVAKNFELIDQIAHEIGLIRPDQSTARQIPWWPLISILGVFSSGKSTFINLFLGKKIQRTGVQAVDDKFTVLCYSSDPHVKTLPGVALDVDPRFPFYRISREIEEEMEGEGRRINAYLQLKTCNSENLKGKILIDSPGFDADEQRNAVLRITRYIIDLSDLVLIFFDAKRPEPGAMRDTLEHLVKLAVDRYDSEKFLYILNQIDATAREDNLEEVVAAWKSALAEKGIHISQFYTVFDPGVKVEAQDEYIRRRLENRRDRDLKEIYQRMFEVELKRSYRILNALEHTIRELRDLAIPQLLETLSNWRNWVLRVDFITLIAIGFGLAYTAILTQFWTVPVLMVAAVAAGLIALALAHMITSGILKLIYRGRLQKIQRRHHLRFNLADAFSRCANWRFLLTGKIKGWSQEVAKKLDEVLTNADVLIQRLNDAMTNPSGRRSLKEVFQMDEPSPPQEEKEVVEAEVVSK